MTDVFHNWGGDFQISASGDILEVSGAEKGRQRVLRRLLTSMTGYIFVLDYGAGIPEKVGTTESAPEIEAAARHQMFLEEAVSQDPYPEVSAVRNVMGVVILRISYIDANTGDPVVIGLKHTE